MDKTHDHRAAHIYFFIGVLAQQICHQCHVPRMLGIIFISAMVRQMCLAEYIFFFVSFKDKILLFLKSFSVHLLHLHRDSRYDFSNLTVLCKP